MGGNALATQRAGHTCMFYDFQPDVYEKGKSNNARSAPVEGA